MKCQDNYEIDENKRLEDEPLKNIGYREKDQDSK